MDHPDSLGDSDLTKRWCQDMPGVSADDYAKVIAELDGAEEHPTGLVAHVAGPVAGGFRIVDVWESEEAVQRFGETLMPVMQELGIEAPLEIYPAHTFVSA